MTPLSGPEDYNVDSTKEEFLTVFKHELEMFQKPKCDPTNLSEHTTEDIVHDIFRALYGNGGETRGIIWKMAEQSVLVLELTNRQNACRGQVVQHFKSHKEEAIAKDRGVVAFVARHKVLSTVAAILMFFGLSSLWAIAMQKKQATKLESIVLSAVNKHIEILKDENKSGG